MKLDPNILKFTKLGLVIMFPIATLLAWLYERSPQGFIRTSSAAAAHNPLSDSQKKPLTSNTFIGLLTLTVIALFILFPNFSTSDSDPGSGYPDSVRTIAVMPFDNLSNDPEQEYFSDGISEELISALAKVENLKVAGRTSSFSFKGKNDDLKTIGKKLGVNTILDGSVRKFENTVRINAQLVNVSDGYQLWTDTYEM